MIQRGGQAGPSRLAACLPSRLPARHQLGGTSGPDGGFFFLCLGGPEALALGDPLTFLTLSHGSESPSREGLLTLPPRDPSLPCVPLSGHTHAESCVKLPCLLLARAVLRAPGGVENPSTLSKTQGWLQKPAGVGVGQGVGQVERETGHQSQTPRDGATPGGRWGGDGGPVQPGEGAPAHCGEAWLILAAAARTGLSWQCPAQPCGETGFPGETGVQCLSLRFCRVSDPRLCL